jgi:hypothetical protein
VRLGEVRAKGGGGLVRLERGRSLLQLEEDRAQGVVGHRVLGVHRPGVLQHQAAQLVLALPVVAAREQLHRPNVLLVGLEDLLRLRLGLGQTPGFEEYPGQRVPGAEVSGLLLDSAAGQRLGLARALRPHQEPDEEVP